MFFLKKKGWFLTFSTYFFCSVVLAKAENLASVRLQQAIQQPEFMLHSWVELPAAPGIHSKKIIHIGLREAILLALRYNPNIQNAELDRIIQRYQLRLAHNEFELQYALGATGVIQKNQFSGVGDSTNKAFIAAPEVNYRNTYGSQFSLNIDNNVGTNTNYNPLLNLSFTQPLLRGFGKAANEMGLINAIDNDAMNKVMLRQIVIDQITEVITAYRTLILSSNNLQNQRRQLQEAQKTYEINEKKIKAGQLEPTGNIQQLYQIESLNLMVEQAEIEFKNTTQNLLQVIGLNPEMRLAVPSDVQLNNIAIPELDESIRLAFANNSQYLAAKMQLRVYERAFKFAKNQQLWQLDLGANAQAGIMSNVDNTSTNSIYAGRTLNEAVNLTLTIPIRDISRRSQLINAKVSLEKARLTLMATRRALITTVTNTINAISSQSRQYQLAEKQVRLAERSYQLEKKKQQAGISSALDVNNTQNQLIQAQASLISAKIAYLNQLSALQRLLGTTLDEWQIKLRYGQ